MAKLGSKKYEDQLAARIIRNEKKIAVIKAALIVTISLTGIVYMSAVVKGAADEAVIEAVKYNDAIFCVQKVSHEKRIKDMPLLDSDIDKCKAQVEN